MKTTRKPFVAPTIKERASLAKVTLISGGGGGGPTARVRSHSENHSHGHGHSHHS
jgi:hypothetical protein